jgi:hypothetical protein
VDPAGRAQEIPEPATSGVASRLLEWLPTLLGGLLVVIAGVHRAQFILFGGPVYADSSLGSIELLLAFVLLLVLVCGWPVRLVVLAVQRRWRPLGVAAANLACGLALFVLAVEIDTLTLIPT